ncbi:hypothetical protein [Streptomyces sp. AP-93]|uniref:hypothetical protein n=1 Tax=Streptomyces sp. AP-93 TaxID=2929048 RepID=UPI001FAF5DAB|nr:hypothetical protein [Streptomyces sp. AP-93]MCJ0873584.1 hypothetical protein [Streptomyces sp. AP-93]
MTTRRMYFATAALSALALGVAVAGGWGQDFPDGDSTDSGSGFSLSAWVADRVSGSTHVEANVQHADVTPRPAGDVIRN